MSLNNSPKKEFPKEMLVKVANEDLRNFLWYRELSNHFIWWIRDEELRTFFFEKKCRDIKSLTTLEVDEIVFNKIGSKNIKSIKESIYILNWELDYFIDNIDYILDKYHNSKSFNNKEVSKYLKWLYKILDKLNLFIETELLQLNSFLVKRLDNRTIKMLKYILSKIEMISRSMDELETFFWGLKGFSKFKNKFQDWFLKFLKYKIKDSFLEEK